MNGRHIRRPDDGTLASHLVNLSSEFVSVEQPEVYHTLPLCDPDVLNVRVHSSRFMGVGLIVTQHIRVCEMIRSANILN